MKLRFPKNFLLQKKMNVCKVNGLGCGIKANYLHVGPGPVGDVPSKGQNECKDFHKWLF